MNQPRFPFTLRPAMESDATAIAGLAAELGYPADAEVMNARLRTLLESPSDLLLVSVSASEKVIGWMQAHAAHLLESGFRVEILGLVVSGESRRSGVGRALLAEVETWARNLGASAIVVRSNVRRTESHAFYPACGYEIAKTQHVYRKMLRKECGDS